MFFDDPYYGSRFDPYDFDGFGGGGFDRSRSYMAPVSQRARGALDNAKQIFMKHLAEVDTSKGPVTEEIIKFHMVPDMRKAFSKWVKDYGCTATSRQLTRPEQDLINKTRKSLMWYTSVTVSPAAQDAYLAKDPGQAKHNKHRVAAAAAKASSSSSAPQNNVQSTTSQVQESGAAPAPAPVVRDLTRGSKQATAPPTQPVAPAVQATTSSILAKLDN